MKIKLKLDKTKLVSHLWYFWESKKGEEEERRRVEVEEEEKEEQERCGDYLGMEKYGYYGLYSFGMDYYGY